MTWDEYRNNHVRKQEEADRWQGFHSRFMQLANEEEQIERAAPKDRLLRAHCDYHEHPEIWGEKGKPEQGFFCLLKAPETGLWIVSDGVSENFQERFRALAARAGVTLGCPKHTDAEDFWLHRLYLDLLENNSDQLFAASKKGGMVRRVCVASATFCARLERKALEQSEPGNGTGKASLSSRAQNSANTAQSVESIPDPGASTAEGKSTNAARSNTQGVFIDRAIASWKRRSGMPEEALPAAQTNSSLLGIELSDLENLRREVWIKFFDEASLPRAVEVEWESVLSSRKIPDSYVDLALTFALTQEYQKAISRACARLADLLATAAVSRISQAHFREAIWRECLDFAYQLGQWDIFASWVDRVAGIRWEAPVTADVATDREQLERAVKPRRQFFETRIGMYSQEWLSAIDRAIELRRTVSAAQTVNASGETGKQAKAAETKSPRIDPEVAKRVALVKANPGIPADEICETFDRENVPLPTRWLAAGLQTWSRAYKNSDYRSRIDTLISKDRAR